MTRTKYTLSFVVKALYLVLTLCLLTGSLPMTPSIRAQTIAAPIAAGNKPDIAGPGWHNVIIDDPVTPDEARAARSISVSTANVDMAANGLPATAAEVTPEIEALARALQHDPRLIFDYVHNHIDYVPIYGSVNGATGALLAGRGTDADQAALFVALMREAGYTANYVIGDVTYSTTRLANWVAVDASEVQNVFGNGGVPWDWGGSADTLKLTRIWAEATIDSTTYTFDPAMKEYQETSGINLSTATGYNRTQLLNHAQIGATTTTSYTLNLNEAKIRDDMITYTMNLVNYIDANLPDGGVADVIGGREIVQTEMSSYATSLPYALASSVDSRPGNLAGYRHTLQIEHESIDETFNTFQVAARRITVFYNENGSYEPVLRVDGAAVVTGSSTISNTTYPMTVTVEHPYTGRNQTTTFSLESGGSYVIIHDFNTVSSRLIARRNRLLAQYRDDGLADASESVLGESLSLMGLTWHHEVSLFTDLVDRVGDVRTLQHHRVGVMGQADGVFIDVPMGMVSVVSRDGASDTWAAFRAQTMMGSAFEHGVLEQLQGTPSVSTIKLLQISNSTGITKTFLADNGSWSFVEPQLKNYSASTKANIAAGIAAGHEYVLPGDAHITLNQWRGVGYIDDYQSGIQGSMGMIISGGYYGGYGTVTETVSAGDVFSTTWSPPADMKEEIETPVDTDPVDMTTGAFHNAHADLAIGLDELLGLRFVRTYNSGDNQSPGSLGYGWSHDYDIHLNTRSDGGSGLGARGPKDAAALITYAYAALDLLADDRPIEEWMTTALAAKWAMDQLIDNAVTIHAGGAVLQYIQLPDGTFAPPPGVGRELRRLGDHYALQGVGNDCLIFDSDGRGQMWQDANGNALTFAYAGGGQLQTVASSAGVTFTLSYNGNNLLTNVADQASRVVTYTYNTDDELTTFSDAENNTWQYAYDAEHRLTSVTRPEGNTIVTNGYDDWGRVITQTDALSNTTTLYFGGFRNALKDAAGNQTAYYLDGEGRMMGRQDAAGNHFTLGYNGQGQRVSVTDRLGDATSFTYHPQGGQFGSITNAKGDRMDYIYTAQTQTFGDPISPTESITFTAYNLTRIDYPDGANEQFVYDGYGNLRTHTDQAGEEWSYTYNGKGQVKTLTNPTNGVITYTYNAGGTLVSSTDSDTGVTAYGYDAYTRLITVTHPGGESIQAAYNANDKIVSITDENEHTFAYDYDANGNLFEITDPAGEVTQYAYDFMDRITQITDRLGHETGFVYDSMGRLTSSTDPNGLQTSFGYDSRGWLNETTIGGQTWQSGYDDERVPSSSATPLGHTTSYQTDELGYTTAVIDPLGNTASLARDEMGRVTTITDTLSRITGYSYDSRGLLDSVTMPNGGAATYGRNALGLLSQITDLNSSNWSSGYTPMGHIQSITDPLANVWQHTYDDRGRLSHTTYPDGITLSRTYDDAGNLIERDYSDGLDLQYTYDELDRLASTNGITLTRDAEGQITGTENPGISFGSAYDDGGRLKTVTYNNGAFAVTYTYSSTTGLLSRVADNLTGVQIDFTYDADRKLTGVNRSNGVNGTYTYDGAGRLTRIQEGSIIDLQYTLDADGQVVQAQMSTPLNPADYLAEQVSNLSYDAASQISNTGYTYDARGRLTASPDHTFSWDAASRLTGIDSATLSYNGLGDLVTRTEGGSTIHYYYNYALGLQPIVGEKDEGSGQFLRYYVWSPGGRLLYMIDAADGNKVYFYHFDRVGSTLALTGEDGAVSDAYAYTPYGELLQHDGSSAQPFTFVGQWGVRQEGNSSSLYHMRARYYDAKTARFISRDPVWPNTRCPQAVNPYQYAMRNPMLYIDPQGAKGFLSALAQELLGIDLPPTGPWDLVFHATPTGYEGDPEWGYGWNGHFMTKAQREKWDKAQLEEQQRRQQEEEERRLQEWMEQRHERYLARLRGQVIHQARVAARQFGGNREALLKSIGKGGVWVRKGNFWLFFAHVEKRGQNFGGGVWVHVEVNGEVIGIAGDELIAEGHISPQREQRGW